MKKYRLLIFCAIFGVMGVIFLFLNSYSLKGHKNGFQRLFSLYPLQEFGRLDLKYNSYYIAGLAESRIYLANYIAPFHLIEANYTLTDTSNLRINVRADTIVKWGASTVKIDSPFIYFSETITPAFVTSNFNSNESEIKLLSNRIFDLAYPVSMNSLIVRHYDYKLQQGVLEKLSLPPILNKKRIFGLTKQHGSTFSFDGSFAFNYSKQKLFYTYYYQNKFVCLDTDLNFIYEGRTIDTNRVAKINSVEIKSSKKIERLLSAPPLRVNKQSYTDGNLLYVHSALVSDIESNDEFNSYSVLDIYDVNNHGKYHHSIKIPNQFGKRINSFAVHRDIIIAIYDHYIFTYKFD